MSVYRGIMEAGNDSVIRSSLLDDVVRFLRSKSPKDVEPSLRGKILRSFSNKCILISDEFEPLCAGQDPKSCTSTTIGIFYWLHPEWKAWKRSLRDLAAFPLSDAYEYGSYDDLMNHFPPTDRLSLYTIHSPNHKFSIIYDSVAHNGMVVHSNADKFTRGRLHGNTFTFNEYLDSDGDYIRFKSEADIKDFFNDLIQNKYEEKMWEKWFGLLFQAGKEDEYWYIRSTVVAQSLLGESMP